MVICLEQGADLHMAQLMPSPLTVSCFSKIQIGFSFLVPAHLGSPGQRDVKRVCGNRSPKKHCFELGTWNREADILTEQSIAYGRWQINLHCFLLFIDIIQVDPFNISHCGISLDKVLLPRCSC